MQSEERDEQSLTTRPTAGPLRLSAESRPRTPPISCSTSSWTWCAATSPRSRRVFEGGANISDFSPELMARALQAQGIWFQLLSIADQNAAMRRRRHIERERGPRCLARHVRSCARRSRGRRHRAQRDRGSLAVFAHPAGHHRASDGVQARHGAGEVPQDLSSACASSRARGGRSGSGRRSSPTFAIRSSSCG